MSDWEEIEGGGVTTPQGFEAGALACGIKKAGSDKLDLMILRSLFPTVSAATFTSNQVKAAPVRVSQQHISEEEIRAVVANSGNANACTGQQGMADAREMCSLTASALGLRPSQVFVCSTGVIGTPMPMDRIRGRIAELSGQLGEDPLVPARAIMTSDTIPKLRALRLTLGGKEVRIGVMAKGAGMICPNMATMLCFVTTDVAIDRDLLQAITRRSVSQTFNRITIDGDMSTNDTVLVMANGQAGNSPLNETDLTRFERALTDLLRSMAKMIVRDAEKASRFIELRVSGAQTEDDAHKVAKAVANSLLVKCAWNSGRPYWGRIMHAIGYAGVPMEEDRIDIHFDDVLATRGGIASGVAREAMEAVTMKNEFTIHIDLGLGSAEASIYTSDITEKFVEFNLWD